MVFTETLHFGSAEVLPDGPTTSHMDTKSVPVVQLGLAHGEKKKKLLTSVYVCLAVLFSAIPPVGRNRLIWSVILKHDNHHNEGEL